MYEVMINISGLPQGELNKYLSKFAYKRIRQEGKWSHDHFFAGVLLNAYSKADIFQVPQEVEYQYSEQELDMLRKAIETGKEVEK